MDTSRTKGNHRSDLRQVPLEDARPKVWVEACKLEVVLLVLAKGFLVNEEVNSSGKNAADDQASVLGAPLVERAGGAETERRNESQSRKY